MHRRVSTLVALLLALTAGRAGADQIYGMFDSALDATVPQVYVLSIQSLTNAAADNQTGTRQTTANVTKQETHTGDGVLKNLACGFEVAPGLGNGWIVHLVVNDFLSGLTCGVTNTTTGRSCADTVDPITVPAGTRIALQITPFGTPAASSGTCTVLFR